jgi:hypothetical protein
VIERLTKKEMTKMKFEDIKQVPSDRYAVTIHWERIQAQLNEWAECFTVDLDPPYQRGHVWSSDQQSAYIEFILQGGRSGRDIYFNCYGWDTSFDGPITLVDGKQRLTAVLCFLENKVKAFGHYFDEYEDKLHHLTHAFIVHVNNLDNKGVLEWYIFLNSGIAHTSEEIEKVKKMIKELDYT